MDQHAVSDDIKQKFDIPRSRVGAAIAHGRGAARAGVQTLQAANHIVVESAQTFARHQADAGKEVIWAAKEALANARSEAADMAVKTREQLIETLRHGFEVVTARLRGEDAPMNRREEAELRKQQVRVKKAQHTVERQSESGDGMAAHH